MRYKAAKWSFVRERASEQRFIANRLSRGLAAVHFLISPPWHCPRALAIVIKSKDSGRNTLESKYVAKGGRAHSPDSCVWRGPSAVLPPRHVPVCERCGTLPTQSCAWVHRNAGSAAPPAAGWARAAGPSLKIHPATASPFCTYCTRTGLALTRAWVCLLLFTAAYIFKSRVCARSLSPTFSVYLYDGHMRSGPARRIDWPRGAASIRGTRRASARRAVMVRERERV